MDADKILSVIWLLSTTTITAATAAAAAVKPNTREIQINHFKRLN